MTAPRSGPSRRTLALAGLGLPVALSASPASADGAARGRPTPLPVTGFAGAGALLTVRSFPSVHAAPRRVDVWLPPGAGDAGRRHRLLIMHDGQNLFEGRSATYGQAWEMAEAALRMDDPPVILGVWNTPARRREYLPADMERELPQDLRDRIANANGGPPLSEGYLAFLAEELVPWARAALPVSPRRRDTVVMGSSMGGLISLAALCRYPQLFAGAGCLSMHWPLLTDPAAYQRGDLQTPRVLEALDRFADRAMLRPGAGHRLFVDRGTLGLDSLYPPYQAFMDQRLARLGWREATGLRTLVIEGGDHNETSWRTRVDAALAWLF
jgi:pimeloyl-ACP methyl ester carboxylesterase